MASCTRLVGTLGYIADPYSRTYTWDRAPPNPRPRDGSKVSRGLMPDSPPFVFRDFGQLEPNKVTKSPRPQARDRTPTTPSACCRPKPGAGGAPLPFLAPSTTHWNQNHHDGTDVGWSPPLPPMRPGDELIAGFLPGWIFCTSYQKEEQTRSANLMCVKSVLLCFAL